MDKVFIEALEIECVIGIYDWERKIRQPISLDIEMSFDNRKPAASDNIVDTLDYKAISKRLIDFVGNSSYGLVEALAEECCRIIIDEFGVAKVKLKLSKVGAVRGAKAVGVILKREGKTGSECLLQDTLPVDGPDIGGKRHSDPVLPGEAAQD